MPKKGRAKVRETFQATVKRLKGDYGFIGLRPLILEKFTEGDRVRVTVELLRRDAATKKGSK